MVADPGVCLSPATCALCQDRQRQRDEANAALVLLQRQVAWAMGDDALDVWLAHRDTCTSCNITRRCPRGQALFDQARMPERGMTTMLPGGREP